MEITITGQAPPYVSWDASRTMPYADAVFNETLRMAPPVGNDFRIANESDVMPSGGFVAVFGFGSGAVDASFPRLLHGDASLITGELDCVREY